MPIQLRVQEEPEPSAPVSDMARFWGPLWDAEAQAGVPGPFEWKRDNRSWEHESSWHWRPPLALPPYQYHPLEGSRSTRILRLEAGSYSDRLEFHLEHTTLTGPCHDYEALSYSWGSTGSLWSQSFIYNPEGVIRISSTLEGALKRIRWANEPRYVWVDSVCINQEDEAEKGHQVGLMCDIYKRATSVLVWLGSAELHQAIGAFSILAAVASHGQVAGRPLTGKAHFTSDGVSSVGILGLPGQDGAPAPLESDLWRFVAALFERPWFSRVWCIQEIALARTATIMWGDADMLWRWLGLAAARIRVNLCPLIARYDLSGVFNAYLMYRLSQGDAAADPVPISFLELLAMTCQFNVSDARDRVYGLLGLPTTDLNLESGREDDGDNKNKLFVDPDYTLKLEEVYWNVATRVLREKRNGRSLKMLCAVQHGDKIHHPSWVPRWEGIHTSMIAPFTGNGMVNASADIQPDYELVEDGKVLRVRGICLGTVTERFGPIPQLDLVEEELDFYGKPMPPEAQAVRYNAISTLFHIMDEHSSNGDTGVTTTTPYLISSMQRGVRMTSPAGPPHSPLFHTLLRDLDSQRYLCCTLTAGRNWQGILDFGSEEHVADFIAFLHESPETRGLVPLLQGGDSSRFAEAMRNVTKGRRLFSMEAEAGARTGEPQVGLGPDIIQSGDKIVMCFVWMSSTALLAVRSRRLLSHWRVLPP